MAELLDLLGGFATVVTVAFFLLPIITVVHLCKTHDNSKIPWLLFIFTILNCEFWMIYGLKLNAWPIYVCNGLGICTNVFYITCYLLYLFSMKLWMRILCIIAILATFLFSFFFCLYYVKNTDLIGGIACTMNILMMASTMQRIVDVFKFKDNSYIQIWIASVLTINCALWLTYGNFKSKDLFIIIPNSIGLVLNSFLVYLWFHFRAQNPKKSDTEDCKLYAQNKSYSPKYGSDEEMNTK